MAKRAVNVASVVVSLLAGTGCGDPLSPERLDLTGPWMLDFILAPSDFQLDLVENPDRTVEGTWSFPSIFAHHRVWGQREGIEVTLKADSPNIFPAAITARFVSRNRLEGHYYFAGTTEAIVLRRGRRPDP